MGQGRQAVTFEEVLRQASGMLQRLGRVSYRSLKRQFDLDDAYFEPVAEFNWRSSGPPIHPLVSVCVLFFDFFGFSFFDFL